jgi:SRSO17 transposase
MDFLVMSPERRGGCARKRRAIAVRGVSRRSWGRGRWDADALRDIVREYVLETLADETAVLVIDETGFLKQGKASCGVARQYTGSAGKITNCQIAVFASYVSCHGYGFIDRTGRFSESPRTGGLRGFCRPEIARWRGLERTRRISGF